LHGANPAAANPRGGVIATFGVPQIMDLDPSISCHRCGRACDPARLDSRFWLILDARPDGWLLTVCARCQNEPEKALAWAVSIDLADGRN
jgi:hypothetical protein